MRAARRRERRDGERGASFAIAVVIAIGLVPLLDGCGSRHVVVAPETALRRNDQAWTITSEPKTTTALTNVTPEPAR
jgi:hypothetical protein